MNWKTVLEFLVSDVLVASAISLVFTFVSNRHADDLEKQNDETLQQMKDHLDLKLEIIEQKIEKAILENNNCNKNNHN